MASIQTYDSQSLTKSLEQRWNYIKDIFPCDDMPVVTDADKVPGNNSIISWDQETIALPSAANKRIEGADYTYGGTSGSKLTNYVQEIMRGDKVTMLNQMSFHPGIGGTNARVNRTKMLMMQTALLDLEWSMINGTKAIGAAATAAEMGGIKAFVPAAYTTTQTAKAITYNDDVTSGLSYVGILGKNWVLGGKLNRSLVNFTQKTARFDAFTVAGYQRNTNLADSGKGTAVLTYEKVMTAAGAVEIIPHTMVAAGEIVSYNKSYVKVIEVKAFDQDKDVARTGSTIPVVVIGWYSCYVGNEAAVSKASGYTA